MYQDEADTILLGRRTYQEFAAYWPHKTAADDPFADYVNRTPKLVVPKTLKTVEWENTTLITDGVVDELTKLKQRPGKHIAITGSATLVRSPLAEGLVDELRLLLFPIVLGNGGHLFDDWAGPMPMRLAGSRALGTASSRSCTRQPYSDVEARVTPAPGPRESAAASAPVGYPTPANSR